jgi:hypothetical protein
MAVPDRVIGSQRPRHIHQPNVQLFSTIHISDAEKR